MNMKMELPPPIAALKEKFMETEDLILMDGTHVTPEEMWDVCCLPLTGKYRHLIDFRNDLELVNILRHKYLQLSCIDRIKKMHEKGVPVVFTFGGGMGFPGGEIVYGCSGITYGLTNYFNEVWWDEKWDFQEEAHRWSSFESCPGEPPVALMARDGMIPTDLIISGTGIFGDLPCANQLIRKWPIPLHFVDIPFNGKGKEWALEYLTEQLWETVDKISQISGKKVTVDDLNNGIRMMNELYETYHEYVDIVTSAEIPPIASMENLIVTSSVFDFCSDPVALANANRALNRELKERVAKGIRAPGIIENPIRIYMCEKFPPPPAFNLIDDLGGILIGPEVTDSYYLCEPIKADTDDPCRAIAEWSLNKSPWSNALPLEDRTKWLLDIIEKYRPEGVIFTAVWGCQLDPQFSRYIADEIKKKFDIPWMMTVLEDVPVEIGEDGKYHLKANQRTRFEGFMEILKSRKKKRI
jgi:benzoyl-CoA reductase/2-hydroxyglutaryl-CoA dehydratase subunit BcrC/BadD/HgdB